VWISVPPEPQIWPEPELYKQTGTKNPGTSGLPELAAEHSCGWRNYPLGLGPNPARPLKTEVIEMSISLKKGTGSKRGPPSL